MTGCEHIHNLDALPGATVARERAASHPGLVWVGLEHRCMPAVAELRRRVRDGGAGRLRMVSIREHRFPFLAEVVG